MSQNTIQMLKESTQILPNIKDELLGSKSVENQSQIISYLSDSDLVSVYAEWLAKGKTDDPSTQNGFIFEILARRIIQAGEITPSQIQSVKELFMFLLEGKNQRLIWNEERSTPDDIIFSQSSHFLMIEKLIECKISSHAIKNSSHQKESTQNTINAIVNALNGDYQEIKGEVGKKAISTVREKLYRLHPLPIGLSPNYNYVYVLPSDQYYKSKNRKDANLQVVNLPISVDEINDFRVSFFTYIAKHKL